MRAWAAAVIVLLAGCMAPPPDGPVGPASIPGGLLPADAGPGYYLLPHAGGELAFAVAGTARIELFSPDDVRLGSLELGSLLGDAPVRIARPAGDHVLHVMALDGKLRVESGGAQARLHPLVLQVERVLLMEEDGAALPVAPVPLGEPVAVTRDVAFSRAPVGLRAVVVGAFSEVRVEVDGLGRAYEASASGSFPYLFGGGRHELPAPFDPEAVRDGNLTAHVVATDLQGAVLLEATTYVRSLPPQTLASGPTDRPPLFFYGFLPEDPVLFHVAPGARTLTIEGGEDGAIVALFGPGDERLGAYAVGRGNRTAVAVQTQGDHVVALLAGNATLGADAAPAAFDFRPLDTIVVTAPADAAGEPTGYGAAEQPLEARGVLYRVEAVRLRGDEVAPLQCGGDSGVRLRQGGEAILAWFGDAPAAPAAASSALLDGSPLTVWHDGRDDSGCSRVGVAAYGYTR